jgi:holo-[acyl-carrier protein] synthase
MIRGIGCDIIEIERIRETLSRLGERFVESILTQKELLLYSRLKDPACFVAGRFAAKEALSKALGCGIGKDFSWHDVSILNDEKGRPYIVWEGSPILEISATHISISHSKTVAMAYVVLECPS